MAETIPAARLARRVRNRLHVVPMKKTTHLAGLLVAVVSLVPCMAAAQSTQKQAASKKQVRVYGQPLRGHKAGVSCADYSPDGKLVVTSGAAGQLKLWTAGNGKLKKAIKAHEGDVHLVCFFAAGAKIVSVGMDRTIGFFDSKTGSELGRIRDLPEKFKNSMQYLCWQLTADGAHLLLEDPTRNAKSILRVDLQAQTMAEPVALPGNAIKRFALASDGRHLALVERNDSWGQDLHLYDLQAKKTIARAKDLPFTDRLLFSHDGGKLFALNAERWQVWNGKTGKLIDDHEGLVGQARGAALSKDGNKLFAGSSAEGAVVGVDFAAGKVILEWHGFSHQVLAVALSPDEKTVVAGSSDGSLRFFSVKTGREKMRSKGHGTAVTALGLSADGSRMITGSHDREVVLWDTKRKKELARHGDHKQSIICAGFNKDGFAYTVSAAWQLKLHDAAGKVTKAVDLAKLAPNAMGAVASADGAMLLISDWEGDDDSATGRQLVCDLVTGKVTATHATEVPHNAYSLSADGSHAAVLSGKHLAIFTVGSKEPGVAFEPEEWGYYGMALVSAESAVSGNLDGELILWKKGNAKPSKKVALSANGAVARAILAAPDGRRVFVAIEGGVVIYDAELNEQARITAFDGLPNSLALSRDGKQLLCGMADSTALIWSLSKVLK